MFDLDGSDRSHSPAQYCAECRSVWPLKPTYNTSAYDPTSLRKLPIQTFYFPDIIRSTMFCHVFAGTSESEPWTGTGFCFWVDGVFISFTSFYLD